MSRTGRPSQSPNRKHRSDPAILFATIGLLFLGVVIIYAIGPQRANVLNSAYGFDYEPDYFFIGQLRSVVLSIIAFFVAFKLIPYKFLSHFAKPILIFAIGLSVLLWILALAGSSLAKCELGECRWFNLGFASFQPAEVLKLALVVYFADFIARKQASGEIGKSGFWIPFVAVCLVSLGLVVVGQGDLGTGVTIIAIILGMLLMSGVPIWQFAVALAVIVLGATFAIGGAKHRQDRIEAWIDIWTNEEVTDSTYHIYNAELAIGVGGLTGVGIGNSIQATGYLPESINDSVFAIIGETFGFIGLIFIMAVFAALLLRLLRVASHTGPPDQHLAVVGVFSWVLAGVAVNVMAMTALVPVTGITLPLLSYGGTSMLFIAFALGLTLQISCYTSREEIKNEDTGSRGRLRGSHYASRRRSA